MVSFYAALANDRSMNAEIIARLQQGNILQSNIESLRDQFAGQALAGLYASRELQLAVIHDSRSDVFENNMARQAYRQADAMLAIRKAGAE